MVKQLQSTIATLQYQKYDDSQTLRERLHMLLVEQIHIY